jgi:hypothetical protein
VADDDDVGRLVLVRTLERLGYAVDSVQDGAEAVRACAACSYAAVLMDWRLPVLDGLEATARIRAAEREGHRTPIVAVTASALDGDRARCRQAGMDDFVSKPATLEELQRVLERWAGPLPAARGARTGPTLDATALDELRGLAADGSARVLAEVVTLFLARVPERLAQMEAAVRADDRGTLENLAHALKTSCANVGAHHMAQLSDELERAAHDGAAQAAGLLASLQREFAGLRPVLLAALPEGAEPPPPSAARR